VRRYTATEQDPVKIGRELGVDAVLEGSFQQSGDRFRVTLQLVRVSDGTPFWTEKFDEKFTDIFSVQDSISKRVADALALSLTHDERRQLAKHHTDNPEAFRSYLRGRFYWNKRTEEGLRKGVEHFDRAIEQDPLYALAYAGLADCYNLLNNYDVLPATECIPKARQAAMRALEIDETLAEAHTSLALVKEAYEWDQAGAEREYKRAIELNPNYSTAHHWNGLFLVQMGRPDEGIPEIVRAREIEPTSLIINVGEAWGLYYSRQPDKSIDQSLKTLELDPNFWAAHLVLGWAYESKGRYNQAIDEMEKAIKLSGRNTLAIASLGHLYGEAGRTAEAVGVLNELTARSKQRYVSSYFYAAVNAGLGDKNRAMVWLERAYEERSYWLISIKVNPWFDKLRSEPLFGDLERRIGFAQASGTR
jgi:tetratricopeptide (TPR) repeat protein